MTVLQTIRYVVGASRLGAVSAWRPHRVERLQQRRLRRLLRFAVARSAFYREKFRGLDVDRASLADLPTTNKQEISAHFDRVLTDPDLRREEIERFIADKANLGRWLNGRYAVSRTSGSQGAPLLIVQDSRAIELLFAALSARGNATGRPTPLEGLRRLRRPLRVVVVASQRGFYPSGAAFEFMPQIVGPFARVTRLAAQQPDLFQRLNELQPNILVGYSSILDALAVRVGELELTELRQLASSSEELSPAARARIERAFGVPLLDHYATGECLFLSDGCPTEGGAHVNADWSILEVVDDHGRAVEPGQLGAKVLITNLANRVQPFIRYEIDDRVAWAIEPCRCGSRLPRIGRVEGRAGDLFWTHDGRGYHMLSGVLFHAAADATPGVREWQAVQLARNHIEMRLQPLPGTALDSATTQVTLRAKLVELGLPAGVHVDVRAVASLSPDANTGKLRRMISHVGEPYRAAAAEVAHHAAPLAETVSQR